MKRKYNLQRRKIITPIYAIIISKKTQKKAQASRVLIEPKK